MNIKDPVILEQIRVQSEYLKSVLENLDSPPTTEEPNDSGNDESTS